ncbi:MAG: elongation factor P [Alphaproteobacteria bacterium]|nr:elongation factor P [Rickettsiales bacterium]
MALVNANSLKSGYIIEVGSQLYKVISTVHVKPGKGGAFIQASLKNVKTGLKLERRFRSEENVEKVRYENIPAIVLFLSKDSLEITRTDTFEQLSIDKSLVGDKVVFLNDGMEVSLVIINDTIIDIQLQEKVELEVVSTEPKMKNQTVTMSLKQAILSNGITVMVPQFIEEGDRVSVKTENLSYVERV